MAPAPWTNAQIIAQIDSGDHWSSDTVTFGFPTASPAWAAGYEGDGFSPFNAVQQQAARLAMQLWGDVAGIDFTEVGAGANPTITFQNTTTNIGYAQAYFPGGWSGAGSLWTNPDYTDLTSPHVGDYSFMAILHEIGHTVGLDHPGPYNGGSPTYNNDALYQQDSHQYTVMSYFDAGNTGADWRAGDGIWRYAQTPMLHDIMVLQSMYGVDTSTRTGDTTYGFNATADRVVFDFTQNTHPILTIWDAGGNDTIDLSGFTSASRLRLAAGTYSDVDNMTHNIAIAYGAEIENAIGGIANDTLSGNGLDNLLAGRDGGDRLLGFDGEDTLRGGIGRDHLYGGSSGDQLYGGGGQDTLFGGAGNDTLDGCAGKDTLIGNGGADHLIGGSGADTFKFNFIGQSTPGAAGRDVICDFTQGEDVINLSPIDANTQLAQDQAFHFIDGAHFSGVAGELRTFIASGHTAVVGDVNGDGISDFRIDLDGTLTLHATDFIL